MDAPNRREFLKQVGVGLAASLAGGSVAEAAAASARESGGPVQDRPNVLMIAVDDLRPALGCYGDPVARSPHIDALAARGVRFARAYCQQAVCNPSRMSLLTGRRPDSIRVWDLKTHFRETTPGIVTLPECFRNQGYFARSIGKIFHGEAPLADPLSWSVPEEYQYTPKRDDYFLAKNKVSQGAQKSESIEFEPNSSELDYVEGKVAEAAVQAIRGFKEGDFKQPFFLAVGFRKPHLPFTGPKHYWDLYDPQAIPPPERLEPPSGAPELALHRSDELHGYTDIPKGQKLPAELAQRLRHGYYAAMSYTDAQIGRVLAELERTGYDKNTIVVFWVDHGFHLGEHGLWAKTTNYEADTHVPLIIAHPGGMPGVCEGVVENLDLFPTLCELAGVKPPSGLEGKSLGQHLRSPASVVGEAAFSQFPRPWFYHGEPEHMGYAVRTESHRYVEWRKFGTKDVVARELYAYAPGQGFETANLADDPLQAERIRKMAGLLASKA